MNVGADDAPDTLSLGVGVGNKRRQAGGHNLSFCITTRSLVVSVGLPKPATNDARTCEDVVRYSEFGARVVRLAFDPTGRGQ